MLTGGFEKYQINQMLIETIMLLLTVLTSGSVLLTVRRFHQFPADILNMRQPPLLQRLRAKKRSQSLLIGVTWYTEETWSQVKATATDPERFEASFKKWKAMAIKAQREFLRSGVRAIECHITPQAFFAWCALNNQENNATSRAEFVSAKLSAAHDSKALENIAVSHSID